MPPPNHRRAALALDDYVRSIPALNDSDNVCVQRVTLAQTRTPGFCNTVNPRRDVHSDAYREAAAATNYTRYAARLRPPHRWLEVPLSDEERDTLVAAGRVRCCTGRASRVHVDELADIVQRLDATLAPAVREHGALFMRLDACSCKDAYGDGAVRPVRGGADAVEQLTRSERAAYALQQRESSTLVLRGWRRDIALAREFRCFFYRGRLTAISQYSPYEAYGWADRPDAVFPRLACAVRARYAACGAPFADCVMDVHVAADGSTRCDDDDVEVLEYNPFGWHMNSGPACFDWQRDDALLRSDGACVHVRVVAP